MSGEVDSWGVRQQFNTRLVKSDVDILTADDDGDER
jgi:hypothetical protein